MDLYTINYLGVLVAGVAGMVLGAFWYGPVFGKVWAKLAGLTEEGMKVARDKGMGKSYALALFGSIVTAYVIAYFVEVFGTVDMAGAFMVIFWPWVGFIATSFLGGTLWENRPWKLYFINIFYYLLAFFVQAVILTYWI